MSACFGSFLLFFFSRHVGCHRPVTIHRTTVSGYSPLRRYADAFRLRDMLRRYSSFITFPIELWAEKTDYTEVGSRNKKKKEGRKHPLRMGINSFFTGMHHGASRERSIGWRSRESDTFARQ